MLLQKSEEDDHENKWDVLKIILLATSQNGRNDSLLARSTQDISHGMQLQVAGDSNSSSICSKSARCCFLVCSNIVTPVVLQVYFQDHSESLDNPNMDPQYGIMTYHSDFLIGLTFRICSPIGYISITLPSYQLINDSNQAKHR